MRTKDKTFRVLCTVCMALLLLQGCAAGNANARETYRTEGITLFGQGRYEEAEAAFAQALSLSDGILSETDFDISMYRALAFRRRGMHTEANTVYDNILALRPSDVRTLYAKGCSLLEEDRVSDACRYFDEAAQAAKGTDASAELDALVYRSLDSAGYKEAALNRTGASRTEPSLVEQYNRAGLEHMERGEYEQAIEAFETGLSLQEEDLRQALMRNRIAAYEYAGNFGTAAELMEAYAARFPEDKEAAREFVFLRTR